MIGNEETCRNGHPRSVENVRIYFSQGRKKIYCRICINDGRRRRRNAKKVPKQLEYTGPDRPATRNGRWYRARTAGAPRRRPGHRPVYKVTPLELEILQRLTDGQERVDIEKDLCMARRGVDSILRLIYAKYGVSSLPAAVAQGLKRGVLKADRKTAKLAGKETKRMMRGYRRELIAIINDRRNPTYPVGRRYQERLDKALAWSEPHAVSVMWALGLITSKHVPQTRNRYRPNRKHYETYKTNRGSSGG